VDLALIDSELGDGKGDKGGLEVLKKTAVIEIPKLLMASKPDSETVLKALRPNAGGIRPAFDFIDKEKGEEAILTAVYRAMALQEREHKERPFVASKFEVVSRAPETPQDPISAFLLRAGFVLFLVGTAAGVLFTIAGSDMGFFLALLAVLLSLVLWVVAGYRMRTL